MKQHQTSLLFPERKNYKMVIVVTGQDRKSTRAIEQIIISAYTLEALENARNEIAKGNLFKFADEYRRAEIIFKCSFDIPIY